ncbi:MAG TPA: alkaline phosphatase family protein [Candidatus Dormibacteraeota bacterium]
MGAIKYRLHAGSLLLVAAVALAPCGPGRSQPQSPRHVFLIVLENHSAQAAAAAPFIADLASTYRVAGNYSAIAHPSVPNYLALTSGQTWGVTDDSYHVLPQTDLGDQLTSAGVTWRAYMEGLTDKGCLDSPFPYDPGHNPFVFYGGKCPSNVVPFTALTTDLKQGAPVFSWISPDDCHNAHSCDLSVADDWLRSTVGVITQSAAWKSNGVLFITWDEDDGSADNRVLTLVVAPGLSHLVSNQPYNHYSLLATIEDLMGVGRLGDAAGATAMKDLLAG